MGDDDPAEVQARTPELIRALIEDAGKDLGTRPAPDEWSVLQRVEEMAVAGELMVIIAGEAVPGDEHVRLAAQAPAERGMRPAAGAGQ